MKNYFYGFFSCLFLCAWVLYSLTYVEGVLYWGPEYQSWVKHSEETFIRIGVREPYSWQMTQGSGMITISFKDKARYQKCIEQIVKVSKE